MASEGPTPDDERGLIERFWDFFDPDVDWSRLDEERQKRRQGVIKQKQAVTGQISLSVRTLAFGSVASCYALLLANPALAVSFVQSRPLLLWSAGFAVAALIVDAVQYLFGYVNVQQGLAHEQQSYPRNWARKGRTLCFLLKQLLVYIAVILLLIAIVRTVIVNPNPAPPPPPCVAACPGAATGNTTDA